jgi:hypothetical protein
VRLSKNEKTVAVFLDVARAYDECWREGALIKLRKLGFTGNIYQYIQNFLTDRHFTVQLGNDSSERHEQQNGIPQGSVISPTIFTIMVNDLGEEFTDLRNSLSQFADDAAIWRTGRNLQHTSRALQQQINKVALWMERWGFQLNVSKTVCMTFSRGLALQKNRDIAIKINNQPIQTVKTTTFLGMTLDTQLTWKKHLEKLTDSCRGLLNIMRYVRGNGWGASTKIMILLYKAFIRGKIDYASVVYDSSAKTNKRR